MATLWDYQNQLRKIAEHRTSGAEQEILAVYSSVLQRLQSIVGRYYTVYSNGEGTLSAADLRLAGQYKGFLQDVLHGLEQLSEPQQEAIRSAVESAYAVCYDGMAAAVKEAASGSTSLQNALHGLSASTPETVAHIVEHPMQKLTLSHVLQKKRRQITHKIRQTLSVGLANGDSYPQMANRIADALHGDYKKAIRVVRTEANRAINRGFQDVAEEAAHLLQGSEYLEVKEWCSAEDGDVRDAHRKLDGKVIPATEAFEIDGKKAQCPGGFGVAELDINCRCFLKYALVKREDFEKKHGKIKGETLTSEDSGGIIKEQERMQSSSDYAVPKNLTESREFRSKFDSMDSDKRVQRQYYQVAKEMLRHRSGTNGEDLYFYNTRTKKWYRSITGTQAGTPDYTEEIRRALQESEKGDIVSFHNHPLSMPPSAGDLNAALKNGYKKGYTIGHDGIIFEYTKPEYLIDQSIYDTRISKYKDLGQAEFEAQYNALIDLSKLYGFSVKEVK